MTIHIGRTATRRWIDTPGHNRRGRRGGDVGSVAVELALSFPFGLLVILLIVAMFHIGRSAIDVNTAAAAASRAASLSRTRPAAVTAAERAAAANLAGRCVAMQVDVDTSRWVRGGAVTVRVSCTITTRSLTGLRLPGTITTTATSTSPLDLYRQVTLGPTSPDRSPGGDAG